MQREISIRTFAKDLELKVISRGNRETICVKERELYRPGLLLAGFYAEAACRRVQIMGKAERDYLAQLEPQTKAKRLDAYFSRGIPCVIFAWGIQPDEDIKRFAKQYNVPLFSTPLDTTYAIFIISNYLDERLASKIDMHGALLDIYGVGILITGKSGIGKSETVLELIQRGHRLVADDVVEIRTMHGKTLVGKSPELLKNMVEIRGIGIIDVAYMYGIGAVLEQKVIDLNVELEVWQEDEEYDKLGTIEEHRDIMGIPVKKLTVPVRPGRNIAIVLEVAARNYRLKLSGQNPLKELNRRLRKITKTEH